MNTGIAKVWVNGEIQDVDEVRMGALDLGVTIGLGCFETLFCEKGEVQDWSRHRARLLAGVEKLRIPLREVAWDAAFAEVLQANGLLEADARVRVMVQGCGVAEGSFFTPASSRVVITAVPLRKMTGPAKVVTSSFRRNSTSPLAGVKSVSYAESAMVFAAAREQGADEVLLCNERNEICEAATANVFFRIDDQWFTPPLSSGCLGGVERDVVLERAEKAGIDISQEPVDGAKIPNIQQAFLTSSLRGSQPIDSIDGRGLEGGELF